MSGLNARQLELLQWLYPDGGQYGECHGIDLDALIGLGLAEVGGEETGLNNNFIAKGRGLMFRAVTLTDKGRMTIEFWAGHTS